MKFSTILTGTIIGVVLFGWSIVSVAASSPKVSDHTSLKVGEKVLLNKDKLKAGTIEDIVWRFFIASAKGDRKKAASLASKLNKTDIGLDSGWKVLQLKVTKLDYDFNKEFYIKIVGKENWWCRIYGYSKKKKREKGTKYGLVFEDGIKIGRAMEPTFKK